MQVETLQPCLLLLDLPLQDQTQSCRSMRSSGQIGSLSRCQHSPGQTTGLLPGSSKQ